MNETRAGAPRGDDVWARGRAGEARRKPLLRAIGDGVSAIWRRFAAAREARRTVLMLGELNERQLRDIGLSRHDIEWASQSGSSREAADELVRRSNRRRRR